MLNTKKESQSAKRPTERKMHAHAHSARDIAKAFEAGTLSSYRMTVLFIVRLCTFHAISLIVVYFSTIVIVCRRTGVWPEAELFIGLDRAQ